MKASEISRVGVFGGAGIIGSSWTTYFLWKGLSVVVYDIDQNALAPARERITRNLSYLVENGVLTQEAVSNALDRVVFTQEIAEACQDVQLVQECAPENYEVKKTLVAALDKHGTSEILFASSTSGLLITEIAKGSKHPERCIGAHPYNPPHLIPLVEITKGKQSNDETVQTAYDFYKALGKEPIVLKKETLGFISNRLQIALHREAVDLVLNGVCSVEDVDKAVCFGPGLRYALMGPNLTYQLGGGALGLKGIMDHIGPSVEMWLADMAAWKKFPENCADILQDGVEKEMANRRPEQGRTNEEIARWRDDKLLELLRLLGKIDF
ncbi:MAG: NAD-dependent epimerase/dehydratase family protein [Deltaproteobacteria bacterium]|nr:NAD-dependent epimerase/dehydratase family protein [Deltaproteobacteria bacterium]